MAFHHLQTRIGNFLSVPRNFRKEQDDKGNFFGFTPFDTSQLAVAQRLSDNYFAISRENANDRPVDKVFAQAQQDAQQYDPELVRYALMVWIAHDPQARRSGIKIPPLGQRAPHVAAPKLAAVATGKPTERPTEDPPQTNLDWWREDPTLNEHHEHWHIVFPAFPVNGVDKDREGENFAFMHRQMLARYDAERIAVGLPLVKSFSDFSEIIPESYNPDDDLSFNPDDDPTTADIPFTARVSGKKLSDLGGTNTISQMMTYRKQLYDGIEGNGSTPFGQDDRSANKLGNTLETTLHNLGHVMIAYIMTPKGANVRNVAPGVMVDPRTACRDPIFWRWHRYIDEIYTRWQDKQTPYDFSDASPAVIRSNDIIIAWKDKLLEVDQNGNASGWLNYAKQTFGGANFDADVSKHPVVTNELQTEMRSRNFIWTEDNKSSETIKYLYPREYYYFFRVQNTTNKPLEVTLRVFLVPEQLKDSRIHWIELDKIRQTLQPNEKAVFSQDCDESVVIRKPAQKTPEQMDTTAISPSKRAEVSSLSEDKQSEAFFCDCGWPFNLLLPRGNKEGLKCKLFVFISDGVKDTVKSKHKTTTPKKCGSLSFCGAAQWDEYYPDARRMGYPFDKPFKNNSFNETFKGLKNVAVRDVTLRYVDNFPDVSTSL